ncbi:Cullin-3 [Entophlyctis luteolus]|nr:Cullin-3 [Entophlyctis luteolus]
MTSFAALLNPVQVQESVALWLKEDTPSFDVGGYVVGRDQQVAVLYCKGKGVLAGVPFFNEVFRQVGDCRIEWLFEEGVELDPSKSHRIEVARVYGPARNLLQAERPALNMLARASGIASRCRRLNELKNKAAWHGVIAGTRKTTPGFRLVEKYAMLVGGIDTHRIDLSSMIMLKDNHIWATGSISGAVAKARSAGGFSVKIEVECQNESEADEAIGAGADVVMLDNFNGPSLSIAAKSIKERWAGKSKFLIEGSGGLTEENVGDYFSSVPTSPIDTGLLPHRMHLILTLLLYAALAYDGLRKKSLSISGAIAAGDYQAAVCLPTFSHPSYLFMIVLLTFYYSSSKFTKVGSETKQSLEEDFRVGGQRTALQVFSNGFTGTLIVCMHYVLVVHENKGTMDGLCFADGRSEWLAKLNTALIAAYIGYDLDLSGDCLILFSHYACCAGDTWASELGILSPGLPVLITSFKQVPRGTNGGVSLIGLAASIVGGAFVAAVGSLAFLGSSCFDSHLVWNVTVVGAVCGLTGSLIDSILGATLQRTTFNKRTGQVAQDFRRPKKNEEKTDLLVVAGWEILDNNQVNFVSSLATARRLPNGCCVVSQMMSSPPATAPGGSNDVPAQALSQASMSLPAVAPALQQMYPVQQHQQSPLAHAGRAQTVPAPFQSPPGGHAFPSPAAGNPPRTLEVVNAVAPLMVNMPKSKLLGFIRDRRDASSTPAVTSTLRRSRPLSLSLTLPSFTSSLSLVPSNPRISSPNHQHSLVGVKDLMSELCGNLFRLGLHEALFSDVTLKVLSTSYALHRVLIINNPVLRRYLEKLGAASSNSPHVFVEVDLKGDPNISDESVQIILRRLYGDFTDKITNENLLSVIAASHFFQDHSLYLMCRDFIITIQYTPSNLVKYLEYSSNYDYGYNTALLLQNTLTFLCRESATNDKIKEFTFPKMDFHWFARIVQSDSFFVPSELQRFLFVLDVLKIRFPHFAEYGLAIDDMNTNVLSLGKLSHLPSKPQAKAKRISTVSANDSFSNESFSGSDKRYSGHRSTLDEFEYSPPTKRFEAKRNSTTAAQDSKRVVVVEGTGRVFPDSPRLRRFTVDNAENFAGSLVNQNQESNENTSQPASPRQHRKSMFEDSPDSPRLRRRSAAFSPIRNGSNAIIVDEDLHVPSLARGESSPVIPKPPVLTAATASKSANGYQSVGSANGSNVKRRSGFEDGLFDLSGTKINRRSYTAVQLMPETVVAMNTASEKERRRSMFDTPTHHDFHAQNYSLFFPNSENKNAHLASTTEMTRGISAPALKTKRSRRANSNSAMGNGISLNNSAEIEPAISLVSKGILYASMSREDELAVRSEKSVPTFVLDRHFRIQRDLEEKIAKASLAIAETNGNPEKLTAAVSSLGFSNPVAGKTPFGPRSFMKWLLDEEMCKYDSLDIVPVRFSVEFSNLSKALKGSDKITSDSVFFAGSQWYIRFECKNSEVYLTVNRKQSPFSPYQDNRPEAKFWCRICCYASASAMVTDAYTFEVENGVSTLSAPVIVPGASKQLYKELNDLNAAASGKDSGVSASVQIEHKDSMNVRRGKPLAKPMRAVKKRPSEDSWATLETAIREIQRKNPSELSFEVLYRSGYNMVRDKKGDKLYAGAADIITEHLTAITAEVVSPAFPSSTFLRDSQQSRASDERNQTASPSVIDAGLPGRVSLVGGSDYIRTLKQVWEDHLTCMIMIRDILLDLQDRIYVRAQNLPCIYDYGLDLFRDIVLHSKSFPVEAKLVETLLNQILLEREGELIDKSAIKSVTSMLLNLSAPDARSTGSTSVSTLTTYEGEFEKYFLETSRQFYKLEATKLLETCDAKDFLLRVEKRFAEEDERVSAYLSPDTGPKLTAILEQVLLEDNVKAVIQMENSGIITMLANNNAGDLARMYTLFGRVPSGHRAMCKCISQEIQRLGHSVNELYGGVSAVPSSSRGSQPLPSPSTGTTHAPNPVKWVEELLEVRNRFNQLVETAFAKSKQFVNMMNDAIGIVVNANRAAGEFLSLFIDENLKKGTKGKYETDIDAILESTVPLFRLLIQKDAFERYYKQHLAKRLLYGRSISEDAEKGFIAKLKVIDYIDEARTAAAAYLPCRMFSDIRISEDMMSAFKALPSFRDKEANPIELNVKVLTVTLWPSFPATSIHYPRALRECLERFERYYLNSRHTGRKLSWLDSMGNADLRASFPKGKKEINVSALGMIVLLTCFNDDSDNDGGVDAASSHAVAYPAIAEATGIGEAELKRTLQSLSLGKHRILVKSTKKKDVADTDTFAFNADFASPLNKIKILTISANSSSGSSGSSTTGAANVMETDKERLETLEKIDEDRKHQVEAAIVRIMKSRKRLDHTSLVLEVTNQLQARFMPAPTMVKTRIEGLIEREYLERDPDDRRMYNYLA